MNNRKVITKRQIMLALMKDPIHPRSEEEALAVYESTVQYLLNWNIIKRLGDEKFILNVMRYDTSDLVQAVV